MPTSGPTIDATLTTEPRPAASMRRPNARQQRYTPDRLTSSTASQSSSVNDSAGRLRLMPALQTSSVGSPSRLATVSAAASADAVERTSSATPACPSPSAAASASATAWSWCVTATRAPAPARAVAIAAPMPCRAPVTTATSPASEVMGVRPRRRPGVSRPARARRGRWRLRWRQTSPSTLLAQRRQMRERLVVRQVVPGQPFVRAGHVPFLQPELPEHDVPRLRDARGLVEGEVAVEALPAEAAVRREHELVRRDHLEVVLGRLDRPHVALQAVEVDLHRVLVALVGEDLLHVGVAPAGVDPDLDVVQPLDLPVERVHEEVDELGHLRVVAGHEVQR